ncbi:carbohydrate-binding domain-containing protein [Chondrinema litorale]|uniref:carbohydrate-binding domain-containing protein n=1 Tax=Chondrinema litorale TaxID=2994555 RepID=UPI0025431E50|nr:carbohydrate-binding domain-containing protein [Chondrinema litorale]UZR98604.1 carbohydrate-binding domain-containing protein [Chondrinema litorale]
MNKGKFMLIALCFSLLTLFVSCEDDIVDPVEDDSDDEIEVVDDTSDEVDAENGEDHESSDDYTWDESSEIVITLSGSSITTDASEVTVDGSIATITSAGNYRISGSLSDGQIIVDTDDSETVRLILDGVNITSSNSSPLYIASAEKTIVILPEGSDNYLTDTQNYVFEGDDDEPDAALFSKDDLSIYGEGTLTVDGNYNEAIKSKDGLIIASGNLNVTSVDDGIQGKDYLIVRDGNIVIDADGDGLKSSNDEETELGYITIESGTFNITAGADGIQAETDITITGGDFTIIAGGGSDSYLGSDDSAKGIKSVVVTIIDGGTFNLNTADDAIHSDGSVIINGGDFEISTGDDGLHSDESLTINGGNINVIESYEGIESGVITINDGEIHVISSDDGLNVAGGNDSSGGWGGHGAGSGSSSSYYLYINGGYIVVNATGDGLDANGSIVMTDGVVLVNGPTSSGNGALDYDQSFSISGGYLIAAGSSGMAQAPSSSSEQSSILVTFNNSQTAEKIVSLQTSDGTDIVTFAPAKKYQSIVISTPELTSGSSYNLYLGGSSTGTETDGLYEGGTYTPGSTYSSFVLSGTVTRIN